MTPTRDIEDRLRWTRAGTELVTSALAELADSAFEAPSALPDWSRSHVVAHLSGNARALRNLVHWAATGEETPMYSSAQQRMADILSGAALPVIDQRTLFAETAFELSQAMEDLTAQQWAHAVRTVQGRTVLAEQVPWLRSREVLIHVVDLQAGVSWNDLPHDFLNALVEDIAAKRSLDGGPRLVLQSPNGERLVEVAGPGQSTVIEGATPDIAAYLAGREHGDLTIVGGGILPSLLPWI